MQTGQLWDIFCTVIDNHGDLGVCWRLTHQLREAGHRVRLWVDDASALSWMAPTANEETGIQLHPWTRASDPSALAALPPADVWIEAFGCQIPDAFVTQGVATRAQPPLWINLEYLSAEDWVARMHGLPSPVMSGPARGWTKRFFYPGFTSGTGGLLRETDLLQRQQTFDRQAWRAAQAPQLRTDARLFSLFCYEPVGLPGLLKQLTGTPDLLLVTPGRPLAALQHALQSMQVPPPWNARPYTDQAAFDEMLWACDLNFVRGEDSLVRALWAGQPFVWHIYPQDDLAHHAKLEAFLDWLQAPDSLRHFHRIWNGLQDAELPRLSPETLSQWAQCTKSARQRLLTQDNLTLQLCRWANEKG